ncbi:MAG: septal ring lytic transglycosylase RlpA family protein, partial [Candidatus Neomarinimicrobiota bacterium]
RKELHINNSLLMFHNRIKLFIFLIFFAVMTACGIIEIEERDSAPTVPSDVSSVPDAVPKSEPRSRYGNPDSYIVFDKRYYVMSESGGFIERGIASWYGKKFHGRRTSSGETYDMYAMTAAHKTLPLPTYAEVINLENKKRIIVKVNDRGPFHENRIIDLSYTAATKLGIVANGTGLVEVRAIDPNKYPGKGAPVRTVSLEKGGKGFFIQLGAFANLLNAERLREKLGPIGDNLLRISQVIVEGETIYRVRIGPLFKIDDADKIVTQLASLGVNNHHIVIN